MTHGAIDLHKKSIRVCLDAGEGKYEEFDLITDRGALTQAFAKRARLRLLIEASTESE